MKAKQERGHNAGHSKEAILLIHSNQLEVIALCHFQYLCRRCKRHHSHTEHGTQKRMTVSVTGIVTQEAESYRQQPHN